MTIDISLKNNKSCKYKIHIKSDWEIAGYTKATIITNSKIALFHMKHLISKIHINQISIIEIQDGEKHKNIDTVKFILNKLSENKLDRKSLIINFGGGVVGDIGAFSAGVFLRRIDYIHIPTTLLSQVDSSIGGKCGVNSDFGKNLIGLFNQPKAVYVDKYFLQTLPKKEFYAGMSEIIKISIIKNKSLFDFIKNNADNIYSHIEHITKEAIRLKAQIVQEDEKEIGIRAILNYGHTFAHAIEKQNNYKNYLHGEAVSMGMNMENKLAFEMGYLNKEDVNSIKNLCEKFNLPTSYTISNIDEFYNNMLLDKKSINDKIKFIVPKGIGDFKIIQNLSKEDICNFLKQL